MPELRLDLDLLQRFEAGLDPRRPERSAIPARLIGRSEVCAILAIGERPQNSLIYRRMPMFGSASEAERYIALHRRYLRALGERAGVRVAPSVAVQVPNERAGRVVVYVVQEPVPEDTMGHEAIYRLSPPDVTRLVLMALQETAKVFDFNRAHHAELELGFDAQIAHWAISSYDPSRNMLPERARLLYLNTSTPLLRRRGQEQLDPELFLRSAPLLLLPLVRRTFLPEMMNRYYDFRRVALDLIAGFQREGRDELIPDLIDSVNWFFLAERQENHFLPIMPDEIRRYHRYDASVWRVYLALRRFNRAICRLRRQPYPYILPRSAAR